MNPGLGPPREREVQIDIRLTFRGRAVFPEARGLPACLEFRPRWTFEEFLARLNEESQTEAGDFKRCVDAVPAAANAAGGFPSGVVAETQCRMTSPDPPHNLRGSDEQEKP